MKIMPQERACCALGIVLKTLHVLIQSAQQPFELGIIIIIISILG